MTSSIQVKVHGTVAEGLEPVKELFQEQFNKGEELSAQVGPSSPYVSNFDWTFVHDFVPFLMGLVSFKGNSNSELEWLSSLAPILFKVCVYLKGNRIVDLAGSSSDSAYTADSVQVCAAGEEYTQQRP